MKLLAYRMLGSVSEAEDVVQDASLRWLQSAGTEIDCPEAWLVSVTTRLCIDRLRRLSAQRAVYVGRWLPEPVTGEFADQPDQNLKLSGELSMAFLVVLERLSPDERAAFLLHEVFDCSFADIAMMLGKSAASCRQLARRARLRIREARPRFEVSREAHERLVLRFLQVLEEGNESAVLGLLAEDATLTSDGGGKVRVSKTGIFGADRIARLIRHGRLLPRQLRHELDRVSRHVVQINGEAGIITFLDGRTLSTLSTKRTAYESWNSIKWSIPTSWPIYRCWQLVGVRSRAFLCARAHRALLGNAEAIFGGRTRWLEAMAARMGVVQSRVTCKAGLALAGRMMAP